jgi:ABC-type transport system involved in multi-copper enzyme maturation permease subunit
MMRTLISKELRAITQSPKFVGTFAVCAVLMFVSVYVGIREYQASVRQYETAQRLTEQRLQEQTNWFSVANRVHRAPNPLQIFVSGLSYDIGRFSEINTEEGIKLRHSVYSDDPIFAVFRFVDFTFIVQIVLALFAVLFTYDAVNGEREGGTLRLVFANAVPRARYLLAKCAGAWLGLVIPLCVPLTFCLLLVTTMGVPLSASHWARLLTFLGVSLLYFTFFIVAGVCLSTFTRRSNVSFLLALVVWLVVVLVIPRAGVLAAGRLVTVPSVAEIEGRRDGFAKAKWAEFYDQVGRRWERREEESDPHEEMDDEEMWGWMQVEDSLRREVERDIDEFESKLAVELRRRRETQERLGLSLGRLSPTAAYQLAAMALAGTSLELKSRYEDALNEYRERFKEFVTAKQQESGPAGGIMISITDEGGFEINHLREGPGIDYHELPRFTAPRLTYATALLPALTDIGVLAFYTLLAFAGAFVRFLYYDVR